MTKVFRLSFFVFLFFISLFSFSQNSEAKRANHWYFGNRAGIDFNSGSAVSDTSGSLFSIEGCSAISDTAGNLLFYTNGDTVWNSDHQVMPNGTGLMGHWSGWQNSIVIPKPEDSNIYYIFTVDAYENSFINGLRYSIIDMTLNGGLGDITVKNILLFAPNTEELAAVFHGNCKDIWVMSQEAYTNNFYSYLVTSAGVDSIPVITTIGNNANTPFGTGVGLKFSPNGKKLAKQCFFDYANDSTIRDTLELYDFNNTTGALSNKIVLADTSIYSFNFSCDNSKLYMSTGLYVTKVYQYDLSINTQVAIAASKTLIHSSDDSNFYMEMQSSPDDRIFIAKYGKDSLSVINNPNINYPLCNYIDNAFYLSGKQSAYALPNFIESYFDRDSTSCFYTSSNNLYYDDITFSVYPNPFSKSTTLELDGNLKQDNLELYLYNIIGEEQKICYATSKQSQSILIQRNNLAEGIYILKIKYNNLIYSKKLLIID